MVEMKIRGKKEKGEGIRSKTVSSFEVGDGRCLLAGCSLAPFGRAEF